MKFDIVEFYPSITEGLLHKAIKFAKLYHPVTDSDIEIIRHARKSVLFSNQNTWVKAKGANFDVTMGAYDGAEVCELVGLFLLSKLSKRFGKQYIGLYRDDGLSATSFTRPQADRARKDIIEIFRKSELRVTVEIQLVQTDFLDINLDLRSGKYWPYRKPNNEPLYINASSNHPPNVLKQLPTSIMSRIRSLSCDEVEFDKAAPAYRSALESSGHQTPAQPAKPATAASRQRRRKVIWFNPPYNQNVSTDVARQFLKLISKHFPKHHKYSKLFNRNNAKCSYSCMPSMGAIINSHNVKVLREPETASRTCNCRPETKGGPIICPLDGKCLTKCIIYKASVTAPGKSTKTYIGLSEREFKDRYTKHKHSFTEVKRRNDTSLSTYMWSLKDKGH